MREDGQAEQSAQVADIEQLADDAGRRRHGGQPGEAQSGSEQVEGQIGARRYQVEGDQDGARAIHPEQHVFTAEARDTGAGEQAAENIGGADDGQRPTGDRRRQAAQIDFAGQVRDEKSDVESTGEESGVQQPVAAVGQGGRQALTQEAGRV